MNPVPSSADDQASGATPSGLERAEHIARRSYGRLLALLAAPTGDIQLAEDALGDAFEQALVVWPTSGVPDNPDAWLLTVARNRQRDVFKSASHRTVVGLDPEQDDLAASAFTQIDPLAIPDKRLELLFVCSHPAIEPKIRTPLMLQTVLGFKARQVARVFAVPAATMAQRLVRAKGRIRDARIPFVMPDQSQMPARVNAVFEAIYGAYAIDWWLVSGGTTRGSLAEEALYLAVTLAELLGDDPEALGLAALISLSLSREEARRIGAGFVPLERQDVGAWDRGLIRLGERYLRRASRLGRIGRFQLEAAIQSVHCARAASGRTDWGAVAKLYAGLVSIAPTLGARVAFAAALGRAEGPDAGLQALDGIADEGVDRFQPAWATRAYLLTEAGRVEGAREAYRRAIALTADPDVGRYLELQRRTVAEHPSRSEP